MITLGLIIVLDLILTKFCISRTKKVLKDNGYE